MDISGNFLANVQYVFIKITRCRAKTFTCSFFLSNFIEYLDYFFLWKYINDRSKDFSKATRSCRKNDKVHIIEQMITYSRFCYVFTFSLAYFQANEIIAKCRF